MKADLPTLESRSGSYVDASFSFANLQGSHLFPVKMRQRETVGVGMIA